MEFDKTLISLTNLTMSGRVGLFQKYFRTPRETEQRDQGLLLLVLIVNGNLQVTAICPETRKKLRKGPSEFFAVD